MNPRKNNPVKVLFLTIFARISPDFDLGYTAISRAMLKAKRNDLTQNKPPCAIPRGIVHGGFAVDKF